MNDNYQSQEFYNSDQIQPYNISYSTHQGIYTLQDEMPVERSWSGSQSQAFESEISWSNQSPYGLESNLATSSQSLELRSGLHESTGVAVSLQRPGGVKRDAFGLWKARWDNSISLAEQKTLGLGMKTIQRRFKENGIEKTIEGWVTTWTRFQIEVRIYY
jgi:hypothetical protein